MEANRSLIRVMISVGLAVGLGLAGRCPCTATGPRMAGQHAERHNCPCFGTRHCCCGASCQCGQAPNRDRDPVAPGSDRSNDRSQTIGFFWAAALTVADDGAGMLRAFFDAACHPSISSSLVACGTRLNC